MKKHLRMLCLMLTVIMCIGIFIACNTTSDDTPDDATDANMLTITNDFVITQPARPNDIELYAVRQLYFAFSDAGLTLTASDDSASEAPKNEILIGNCNRDVSIAAMGALGKRDYSVAVHGDADSGYKITIAAIDEFGMKAAVEYFISNYLTGENVGEIPADLVHNYNHDYPCENITIAGKPIADYKIVYAEEGVTSPTDSHYGTFIQTAKYADTANAIADMIEEATSVRPDVIPDDSEIADGTPVILFGKTVLPADDFAYTSAFAETGSYTGKLLDDGTVVLAGDNACAVYAAGEALLDAMSTAKTDLASFDVSDVKDLIKVACIGDSITHGTNSSNASVYNYPVYLQRMLGYDYYVEKYGAPGYSLTTTDTYQYMSYSIYNQSLDAKPDVVLIMLGTNDCNPNDDYKDWTNPTRATTFKSSAATMINAYRRANNSAQIYMMTPPTVPSNSIWASNVETYAVPLVKEIAESNNCLLVDIHAWSLKNKSTFTEDGGDGLHPSNERYADLAEGVFEGIIDTIKKPE